MALLDWQISVNGLVMGPGTNYIVMREFAPFNMNARADSGDARAWGHGSWGGAEWAEERVIEIPVRVEGADTVEWWHNHSQLMRAFAPVGESASEVEFRFAFGGREFVVFGRPRMVEPDVQLMASGISYSQCAFVALDPFLYSGDEFDSGTVELPQQIGGLPIKGRGVSLPFRVDGDLVGGFFDIHNEGTSETGLRARIDGPVVDPRIVLLRPDESIQSVRYRGTLIAGRWLEIDSRRRTAFLNGLSTASASGYMTWEMDPHPILPGVTTARFRAGDFDGGTLQVWGRSAWF